MIELIRGFWRWLTWPVLLAERVTRLSERMEALWQEWRKYNVGPQLHELRQRIERMERAEGEWMVKETAKLPPLPDEARIENETGARVVAIDEARSWMQEHIAKELPQGWPVNDPEGEQSNG